MLKGSIVALVTPMQENGDVDYQALRNLVEFHIKSGTSGIVAVGTTGESATLPFDEHLAVVAAIVGYANGRIPVIAGAGANSTDEAVHLQKVLAPLGVDAFLSVVPYYNKPQQKGLVAHFNTIADATDVPVILYNVPARTALDMLPETVATLSKHQNIIGIKEATGNLQRLTEIKSLVTEDFLLFSGDDATGLDFMLQGGHGVISVTNNVQPARMAELCKAALSGDAALAKEINQQLAKLHELLFVEPNPAMPKWALYKMNKINSAHMRLPMVLPEKESQALIESELKVLGELE